jgi:hypothetical protein
MLLFRADEDSFKFAGAISGAFFLLLAVILAGIRIWSGHHTIAQILAGAFGGWAWAYAWIEYFHGPIFHEIHNLFSELGDAYTFALLVAMSVTGIILLGPVDKYWKESFRKRQARLAKAEGKGQK